MINSFNDDLPYNQFLIEQIAGDLLANPTKSQQVATGYLRNSMINEEGGIDPEQFRMEAMFDRMDAIGKGILGLTIQCAQCHTHKYDPLTHDEYYRMFAFLNNAHEANIAVYSPDAEKNRQDVLEPNPRRSKTTSNPRTPTGPPAWPPGKTKSEPATSPPGPSSAPRSTTSPPEAPSTSPSPTAPSSRPATPPQSIA